MRGTTANTIGFAVEGFMKIAAKDDQLTEKQRTGLIQIAKQLSMLSEEPCNVDGWVEFYESAESDLGWDIACWKEYRASDEAAMGMSSPEYLAFRKENNKASDQSRIEKTEWLVAHRRSLAPTISAAPVEVAA